MFSAGYLPARSFWISLALVYLLPVTWMTGLAAEPARDVKLEILGRLVQDPSAIVRMEALRSLAKFPSAKAAELALSVLNQPMDPNLDYALWLTINDLSDPWIASLESGAWLPEGREKQLEFALKAIKPEQASRVLAMVLAKRPFTPDGAGPWIELVGSAGTARELRELLDRILSVFFDPSATARGLKALSEAQRLRKAVPSGSLSEASSLMSHSSPAVQVEALRLVSLWKQVGPNLPKLSELAGSPATAPEVRREAFNTLRSLGGPGALEALSSLAASGATPPIQQAAVGALAALDLGRSLPLMVSLVRNLKDESAALDFWRAILPIKGAGKALAGSLPASGIDPSVARAGMRVAREGGRSDLDLVAALAQSSGLAVDTQAFNAALIQELASKAIASGDPARGESVYRRSDLACVTCHGIGGSGGKVGPDLTSIGASAPMDYLVESLVLPNAKIKEGFNSLEITTRDGSELIGTLARESTQEVVLRNAAGADIAIAKNEITHREQGVNSLMPAGLLEILSAQEQLDLFAFLSRLGKPGDFDASKGGVARLWFLANLVHTDVQNGDGEWAWKRPYQDKRWTPLLSLVNGKISRQLMAEATKEQFWTGKLALLASSEVIVAQDGMIRFVLECPPGPELWIDGRKVGDAGASTVSLTAGSHRVIVQMPPQHVPDSLQLRSPDASFRLN